MANKIPTGRTLFQVQRCGAQALITTSDQEEEGRLLYDGVLYNPGVHSRFLRDLNFKNAAQIYCSDYKDAGAAALTQPEHNGDQSRRYLISVDFCSVCSDASAPPHNQLQLAQIARVCAT